MKKSIEWIHLSPSLAERLREGLLEGAQTPEVRELLEGLEELREGKVNCLVLETQNGEERALPREVICCGILAIDPKTRKVTREGREVSLTPKEFDILYFLAKNRGEVFTKEQIYQAVWEGDYLLDDSNIMAFIRKLRKKIEPNPDAPEYIQTIWGIGYRFREEG